MLLRLEYMGMLQHENYPQCSQLNAHKIIFVHNIYYNAQFVFLSILHVKINQ